MSPQYLTDYELAVERSLHGSDTERRLAEAFLALHDQLRQNQDDCPYCGCPST